MNKMVTSTEFEILAKIYRLDLNKNEHNYLNPTTVMCHEFYMLRQAEIGKLEHDLISANCAAAMFQHVLDNPVVKKEAVAA